MTTTTIPGQHRSWRIEPRVGTGPDDRYTLIGTPVPGDGNPAAVFEDGQFPTWQTALEAQRQAERVDDGSHQPAPTPPHSAAAPRFEYRYVHQLIKTATAEVAKHGDALRAGGYVSGHGDELLPTDPVEFSHQDAADIYMLAAHLIGRRLASQERLLPEENAFVASVLNHAGIAL